MAARFVDEPPKLFLGMGIIVDEALIGMRLFDRIEVLALDILKEGDFERFLVAEFANDGRDFVQARPLRRAPAPLAGDDLEAMAVRADDDRLDGRGELDQCLFLEDPARLAGMRLDACDRNHLDRTARAFTGRDRRLLRD